MLSPFNSGISVNKDSLKDDDNDIEGGTPEPCSQLPRGPYTIPDYGAVQDVPKETPPVPFITKPKPLDTSIPHGATWSFYANSLKDNAARRYNGKILFYPYDHLLSSRTLLCVGASTLVQRPAVHAVIYATCLAIVSALTVYFAVPDAHQMDMDALHEVKDFLKVFITFMLAFYVQSSFGRWWQTVMHFKDLLNSFKELIFFLVALNATNESILGVERMCIASAYLFNTEMHNAQATSRDISHHDKHLKDTLHMLHDHALITEAELKSLEIQCKAECNSLIPLTTVVWKWISLSIQDLRVKTSEGPVPLPTPFSIRVLALCQKSLSCIESLKTNVIVQMPYSYANLLSTLVFINNTLIGLSCGTALAVAYSEIQTRDAQLDDLEPGRGKYRRVLRGLYGAVQATFSQLLYLVIEPLLYTSCLHIGMILCYPFGDEDHSLPSEAFIATAHSEMLLTINSKRQTKYDCLTQHNLGLHRSDSIHRSDSKIHDKHGDDEVEDDDDGDDDGD